MNKTRVVHCKKEPYDVLIDRSTILGNPFIIGRDGTREEVIEKYRSYVPTQPRLMARLRHLKDKTLGCWCKPNACHGDVLAEMADEME